MKKLLNILFPIIDHLYIFQCLEYENGDFVKWFFRYPFKRGLQRKHTITWTAKARILYLVAGILIILLASFSSLTQWGTIWVFPLYLILYSLFSPFFLITANALFRPLENYQKNKLIKAAQRKRNKLKDLKVVAIVGSFAKTSTKNMLYTLLWKDFYSVKTPKSYNTAVSIARSFLSDVKENTQVFLVEMDAYHPGEIKQLCSIVKPNLGIITAIGEQHLERFGTMEKLAETQFELADALKAQENTILFLNADDEWSTKLYPDYDGIKQVFFGIKEGRDVQAKNIKVLSDSTELTLRIKSQESRVKIPLAGEHQALNFAAAAAIAYQLGLPLEEIKKRAELILPTEHRQEVKKAGHITVIDNSYNTNPASARASLKLLRETAGSEKIVITPGLVELGSKFEEENTLLGREIAEVADVAVIVGEYAKEQIKLGLDIAQFPKEKMHFVSSTAKALDMIYKIAQKDAVVLIENDLPDQYF